MSELTHKFITQLKKDIEYVSRDTGVAGAKLMEMASRLDITEEPSEVPVSVDNEHGRLLIHAGHQAVKTLLNHTLRRRTDLVFFISSMMSLINREEEHITDEHERLFHSRLVKFALEECQGSWDAIT